MRKAVSLFFTWGILCLLFILTALVSSGQALNFSGTWKLNNAKSKLNQDFSMAPIELILVQEGNSLSVESHSNFQGQDFTFKNQFTLDGEECINEGWEGAKVKSTAVWSGDGKTLVIKSKVPMQDGGEVSVSQTYTMNGGNLSVDVSASSSYGDMAETHVYDKQ